MALIFAVAAPGGGRAEYRIAGHPAHVNALPHPSMKTLRTGTVVAAPAAQAPLRTAPPAQQPVATGHAEEIDHAGDHGHASGPRVPRIIVVGVPLAYYYGDQYGDGGAAVGSSAPGGNDDGVAYCQTYDPPSGVYIGDDGSPHPCP
jgi:hypothetical protein